MTDAQRARAAVDWRGLGWTLLFFWYFSGVTQALIYATGSAGFSGLRQSLLLQRPPQLRLLQHLHRLL